VAPYPSVLVVEVPAAWIWRSYFLWRMLGAYLIIAHFADNVELFMRTYIVHKGRIEEIPLTGIPVGLMAGTKYEPLSLDLQSGDTLVFDSDGILECQNSKHEAFGTERLAAALTSLPSDASADEISFAILSATDVFSGQASAQHDDRSLVVLRVTEDSSSDPSRVPVIY